MKRLIATIPVWVVAVAPMAAQTAPAPPAMPKLSQSEWSRLKALTDNLRSPEGCRRVYRAQPGLASAYSSEEFFLGKMANWQGRIQPLEEKQEQAKDLTLEILRREDGTQAYYLTFHHQEPANAITILKSVWRDDSLVALDLLKGFAKVPFSSVEQQQPRYYYGTPPPKTPASPSKNPYAITPGSAH